MNSSIFGDSQWYRRRLELYSTRHSFHSYSCNLCFTISSRSHLFYFNKVNGLFFYCDEIIGVNDHYVLSKFFFFNKQIRNDVKSKWTRKEEFYVSFSRWIPIKMTVRTLQFSRVLLSIAGCLPPSSWTSPFTKSLYKFYTLFVWLLILSLVSAQILDIIINVENQDQFSDNFYITLVVFVSGCKLSIILKHRESILSLIESLEREPFSPMNDEEEKIQMKFNKTNE